MADNLWQHDPAASLPSGLRKDDILTRITPELCPSSTPHHRHRRYRVILMSSRFNLNWLVHSESSDRHKKGNFQVMYKVEHTLSDVKIKWMKMIIYAAGDCFRMIVQCKEEN